MDEHLDPSDPLNVPAQTRSPSPWLLLLLETQPHHYCLCQNPESSCSTAHTGRKKSSSREKKRTCQRSCGTWLTCTGRNCRNMCGSGSGRCYIWGFNRKLSWEDPLTWGYSHRARDLMFPQGCSEFVPIVCWDGSLGPGLIDGL